MRNPPATPHALPTVPHRGDSALPASGLAAASATDRLRQVRVKLRESAWIALRQHAAAARKSLVDFLSELVLVSLDHSAAGTPSGSATAPDPFAHLFAGVFDTGSAPESHGAGVLNPPRAVSENLSTGARAARSSSAS